MNKKTSKFKITGYTGEIQATPNQKSSSFLGGFKEKFEQVKGSVGNFKKAFGQIPKLAQNITGKIKNMGAGLKKGLGYVLKHASSLFSLENIYSILTSSAQFWLSSQNAEAKQLSTNIDYMKYAMGSTFAPIIQWIVNLVYQLMKAIQSVVYALFKVNIYANASAKSYGSMAGNAKKAKEETKQLAGIHDELNNIQNSDTGDSGNSSDALIPSFDLSQIDNTPNSIIDAIQKGNWYEVGSIIGEKLNEAMNSIPWNKIQEGAKKIGTEIANLLNGFIASTDWYRVGNTFAQGVNTIIYFGYSFISTFDWNQFGESIGNKINGFFSNIDWAMAGKMLGDGIKGIFNTLTTALITIDWSGIGKNIVTFITNIDWGGVLTSICSDIGAAIGGSLELIASILYEGIIHPLSDFFLEKIEECGGSIILGLLKGIGDGLIGIAEWIDENMICPFIEAFCMALGIHSPSTVFAEFGQYIIQGLFNGIQSLMDTINQIWTYMKETATGIFNGIRDSIVDIWNTIVIKVKEGASGAWNAIISVFGGIAEWFSGVFRGAWEAVKNVFSKGGEIFTGIKDGILSGLKTIVNAIISGINRVITIPFNGINAALRSIRSANILGLQPFSWINTIGIPQIPTLANGGVLYGKTLVIAGEYTGANRNPEIVTPQNIMEETFDKVLARHEGTNNGKPIRVQVSVGGKNLVDELIDGINEKTRQTGKAQIKVSYA